MNHQEFGTGVQIRPLFFFGRMKNMRQECVRTNLAMRSIRVIRQIGGRTLILTYTRRKKVEIHNTGQTENVTTRRD